MKLSTSDVGLQRRQHVQVARPDIRLNENIIHMSIMAKFNFVQYLLKEFLNQPVSPNLKSTCNVESADK